MPIFSLLPISFCRTQTVFWTHLAPYKYFCRECDYLLDWIITQFISKLHEMTFCPKVFLSKGRFVHRVLCPKDVSPKGVFFKGRFVFWHFVHRLFISISVVAKLVLSCPSFQALHQSSAVHCTVYTIPSFSTWQKPCVNYWVAKDLETVLKNLSGWRKIW